MRFDWYQATVPENPIVLIETLKNALAPGGEVTEGRGRNNYHQSFTIKDGKGDRVAVVLAGGPNGDPNITGSGATTEPFVELVRSAWPVHRVIRFDAAQDVVQEGGYDALEKVCKSIARERRIKGLTYLPDDASDGRTYMMGGASSDVRVRLYDKSAEQKARLTPDLHSQIPENWARVEIQVRPRKEARLWASRMSPVQAWGCSGWTQELLNQLFKIEVNRTHMQGARQSDFERSKKWMYQQYGRVLLQMLEEHGDWACVGLQIGHELKKFQEEAGK